MTIIAPAADDSMHVCPACWGRKVILNSAPPVPCFVCNATGELPRVRAPAAPDSLEHELMCRRCGRCCCLKLAVGGRVFYTRFRCIFFHATTHACKVYARRFELGPRCVPMPEAIRQGIMPADCPYVAGVRGYHPPIEHATVADIQRAIDREVARQAQRR